MAEQEPARPVRDVNWCFRLAAAGAVLFILTILLLMAAVFSEQRSPLLDALDEHGGTILAAEVAATLSLGFAAMAIDRRRTLRRLAEADERRAFGGSIDEIDPTSVRGDSPEGGPRA